MEASINFYTVNDIPIYTSCKKSLGGDFDIKYYLTILFSYPENEWFCPSNGDNDRNQSGFTICDHLSIAGVIAKRSVPRWSNGSFKGARIEFMYNKDMNFPTINKQ